MAARIEFYCEFASPYGYLASTQIEAVAARFGSDLAFRPVLLGPIFKLTGAIPLARMPLKGDYMSKDVQRYARLLGEPIGWPAKQPTNGLNAARAFYALEASDPIAAWRLYKACYRRYWVDELECAEATDIGDVATDLGLDGGAIVAAIETEAVKARTRAANDAAVAAGVFGSPFVVVDGEPFWGLDRLPQIERWLESGGW